jgi:hypothetical protein
VSYSSEELREWIAVSGLTPQGVNGQTVVDIGRQLAVRLRAVRVIRPRDLLVLEFRFDNLVRSGQRLARGDPDRPAHLIAAHQPQSFGEEAFPEIGDQADLENDPKLSGREPPNEEGETAQTVNLSLQAQIRIAGESRTVHRMPDGISEIDWSLGALLHAMRSWPLALDGSARPDNGESRWQIEVGIDAIASELEQLSTIAGGALGSAADRGALNRLADEIALDALTAARRGQRDAGRELQRRADSAILRPVRGWSGSARVDQVVAALYVRARAGHRALTEISRTDVSDIAVLGRLPSALFADFLRPDPPSPRETALEMPYRLIASPLATAGFDHAREPITHGDRTELWHSRMGTRRTANGGVTIDDSAGRPTEAGGWDGELLRFIWSPDYPDGTYADQYTQSLDRLDRRMLVKLTAGYNETQSGKDTAYTPRAVYVRRLMLSALGGDLEAHRRFDIRAEGTDMLAWSHKAAIGRDYFTRVEYSGFLFPFGHRATLVKITERKFGWSGAAGADRLAALRQRFFIILRDRVINYPGAPPQPFAGRAMPFASVIGVTDVTPDLMPPGTEPNSRVIEVTNQGKDYWRMAFWPRVAHGDYRFPMVGIDGSGRKVAFEMPLLFISDLMNKQGPLEKIAAHWNQTGSPWEQRRTPSLGGQTVRMADPATVVTNDGVTPPADVDVPLEEVEFRAEPPTTGVRTTIQPTLQQFPRFGTARARLAAAERLTGIPRVDPITFYQHYLDHGLTGGTVFAQIMSTSPMTFGAGAPSDKVGALSTPDLVPKGLSAAHGVVSGVLADYQNGTFDPAQFFPDAKLLGFFSLKDLLETVALGDDGVSPKFLTVELPDRIETRFTLRQTLAAGEKLPGLILGAGGSSQFTLDTLVEAPRNGSPPSSSVTGELTHFKLSFLGALIIHFDRLRFFVRPGQKPDVDVDLNPQTGVMFGGPLEFVNRLRDFIPANGFSDPPDLSITPAGLTAGYTLGLPTVQVGVLALSNISLGAAFSLPFTGGPPTARFNFAERQNTFNLTVAMFSGGGFVALVAAADGIKEIEAQLEFGAQIAINLGVASGSVYVKGGFYFHYAEDEVLFEGFVELGGRLSVLGLISVSLTFHLSLAYELLQKDGNDGVRASKLFGQATLTVEIDILFFSASVDVTVEKTFVGSEADPKFIDLVPHKAVWDEYCAAYA